MTSLYQKQRSIIESIFNNKHTPRTPSDTTALYFDDARICLASPIPSPSRIKRLNEHRSDTCERNIHKTLMIFLKIEFVRQRNVRKVKPWKLVKIVLVHQRTCSMALVKITKISNNLRRHIFEIWRGISSQKSDVLRMDISTVNKLMLKDTV